MSKRGRFIITSIILSLGLLGIQYIDSLYKFYAMFGLIFLTVILFIYSLREGLEKNMTLTTLLLPALFTLGVGLFWFLLPANLFTRIPIVIFFASGIYVLCLTMNIYSVSAFKNIALLRAARGVGFVLTLLTSFFLFDTILSLRQPIYATLPLYFICTFLLFFQGFWSIDLKKNLTANLLIITLISSLVLTELSILLFFWPTTVVVGSLFLTSGVYLLLGLGQAKLEERLFPTTLREYFTLGIIVFIGMFFATHWG